ncbi:uncharacterized protein LOC128556094 [Mercenaria mercenaria]|uniref:uncharacterized protein LOC128556094 n=1 Tax=Mercenaria mercenaria TaxID=6596 RepID=UPI00234E469F|nr:uncharacterized protein LOC128556094 [Mercenaria mercenaria]
MSAELSYQIGGGAFRKLGSIKLNNICCSGVSPYLLSKFAQKFSTYTRTDNGIPALDLTFALSSGLLHLKKFRKRLLNQNRLTLMYICLILIMMAFDTETNPGPNSTVTNRSDLCGICTKVVGWHPDRGIYCEECSTWYHAQCQGMSSHMYNFYSDHSDEFWECHKCGIPNFASSLFENSSVADSNNSISDVSSDLPCLKSPTATIQHPLHSSTPTGKSSHPVTNIQTNRAPKQIRRKQNIQHLKIITANCQSVKSKKLGFLAMLTTVKPDIVLGTESWLKPHIKNSEVFPPDYKVYRKDRKRRTGGGVFILVSNKLTSNSLPELQSDSEIIWAQIKQESKQDLYVCSAYRPDKDLSCIDEINRTTLLIDSSNNTIIVGGDFNLGNVNWQSLTVDTGATHADESNKLLDLADSFGFQQLIHEPTRTTDTTQNTLDLLFINNPTLVDNIKVIPGFSDHCIPFIDITATPRINYKEKRKILLFDKADWAGFKSELVNFGIELNKMSDKLNVQEFWDNFTSKLESLTDNYVPSKNVNGKHHLAWINTEIKKLLKKRDRLYAKFKKSKGKYLDKLKKLKALIQKKTRKAYWNYINNIVCDPTEQKHGTTKTIGVSLKALRKTPVVLHPLEKMAY